MSKSSGSVIHKNVSVVACDTAVTLKETLHRLQDLDVDAVQIGDRHLVVPANQVDRILGRLKEHGHFPRLVGEPISDAEDDTSEEGEEASGDE